MKCKFRLGLETRIRDRTRVVAGSKIFVPVERIFWEYKYFVKS